MPTTTHRSDRFCRARTTARPFAPVTFAAFAFAGAFLCMACAAGSPPAAAPAPSPAAVDASPPAPLPEQDAGKLPSEDAIQKDFFVACVGDKPSMRDYCDCFWTESRKKFSAQDLSRPDIVNDANFAAARTGFVKACAPKIPK